MSAYTRAVVYCDHFDKGAPAGSRSCEARVERIGDKSEARRAAKAAGWAYVRSPVSARLGEDFCPEHKPRRRAEWT